MITQDQFDYLNGKRAFARLRLMLNDPALSYQRIGDKLGLSRQPIAQLAEQLGIDAEERLRERRLTRPPRVIVESYPPHVAAVIKMIKRSGLEVLP